MQVATAVMATRIALGSGEAADPAVATEAALRYQENIATIEALAPTAQAQHVPLVSSSAQPAGPTAAAQMSESMPAPAAPPHDGTMPSVPAGEPPALSAFPVAPATSALAGAALPTSQEAMEALFRRFPPTIAGAERVAVTTPSSPAVLSAAYGAETLSSGDPAFRMELTAIDLMQVGSLLPGESSAHFVARTYLTQPTGASAWGQDGHIYWARLSAVLAEEPSRERHDLVLGTDNGSWFVTLTASSPEELEALARALADAL